jgi:transitional endoplasmic reticulum ATPase
MPIAARVAPRDPLTDAAVGVPLVELTDEMRAAGLAAGDVVAVDPMRATPVVASVSEGSAGVTTGEVRLNRVLRAATRTRPGSAIELSHVPVVGEASEVVVRLAVRMQVSKELEQHVESWLARAEAVVCAGAVLAVPLPNSKATVACVAVAVTPTPGRVGRGTRVFVEPAGAHGHEPTPWEEVLFDDLGGLTEAIQILREEVQLPLERPELFRQLGVRPARGILLHGPPGTGKTRLIRALAGEANVAVHLLSGPSVVGMAYGETEKNIRKLFDDATRTAPSVILVDELDSIAPNRAQVGSQGDSRAVAQLLAALDGLVAADGVAVVATTNRLAAVDPAFRRPGRFDKEVYVGPPDTAGRLTILHIHTREMQLSAAAAGHLDDVARRTHGFVGADLMQLCREAGMSALRRSFASAHHVSSAAMDAAGGTAVVEVADLEAALRAVQPSSMRHVRIVQGGTGSEELVGVESVVGRLDRLVERALLAPRGQEPSRWSPGLVLQGPPGSGKTHLVEALASRWPVNVIGVTGPQVFSRWVGESEQTVRDLFRSARELAPAVLFLDQADGLVPVRGDADLRGAASRVVNQVGSELDALTAADRVLVIAATSRSDLMDPSITRRGRLGTVLHLGPLPATARSTLLRAVLRDGSARVLDADSEVVLVEATDGWVGNDVVALAELILDQLEERAPAAEPDEQIVVEERDVVAWCASVRGSR